MKTLIASVLALIALNASAAKLDIFETRNLGTVTGSYGINEEMGRAWVELDVDSRISADDSIGQDFERVKVPGLSLVGGSVVLEVEGQQVECAKVRPVGIFRYRMAKETKNCKFTTRTETRIEDDGFETHKVKVQIVSLETK